MVKKEQCPKCAERGNDTSEDNLVIYPDGHAHCFACQYHRPPAMLLRLQEGIKEATTPDIKATIDLEFPKDFTYVLPPSAYAWLRFYNITPYEIETHKFGWSAEREMLIFPVFDKDNNLIMWQGRDFSLNAKKHKYITHGPSSDILHLVGMMANDRDRTTATKYKMVIVTEDLLSAIKVGRVMRAMPVWGGSVPLKTIRRLLERFEGVGIWLDRDKQEESLVAALRGSQYGLCFPIHSDLDPKSYNTEEIADRIEDGTRNVMGPEKVIEPPAPVMKQLPMLLAAPVGQERSEKLLRYLCKTRSFHWMREQYPKYPLTYADYIKQKTTPERA